MACLDWLTSNWICRLQLRQDRVRGCTWAHDYKYQGVVTFRRSRNQCEHASIDRFMGEETPSWGKSVENAETEQLFGELLRSNCHQPACQLFALFAMQTGGGERAASQNNKMNKFPAGVVSNVTNAWSSRGSQAAVRAIVC